VMTESYRTREVSASSFLSFLMTRETGPSRMGERAFRESSADDVEEMVLVRDLKPASGGYSAAFIRCVVPGPPLAEATQDHIKYFRLLPLSALARPRAAFAAYVDAPRDLPGGALTPWSGPSVNVLHLL
jgi:hypothetical protein